MLSEQQRQEFVRDGFIRVRRAFSGADAARMADRIWALLERRDGIQRYAPATWTREQPTHLGALSRGDVFNAVGGPPLRAAIDDLLGIGGWTRPQTWGGPLVTFPRAGVEWNVPHAQWHIDFPPDGVGGVTPRLKLFSFIAPVPARGGGTLVLAGSHRLVSAVVTRSVPGKPWRSPALREVMLRAHPWLHDLMSAGGDGDRVARFMDAGIELDGIALRVVELSGDPGDVVLVHPWLFHAPAPNCGTGPRMMLSGAILGMPMASIN